MSLIETLLSAKKTGEAEQLWVRRCPHRRCWQVGAWRVRDRIVVGAAKFKVSPQIAAEYGWDRITPGRAWFAEDAPSDPVWVGCDHQIQLVRVTTEPRLIVLG